LGATLVSRIIAIYRVAGEAASIETRAQGIALEQSIEAPLAAVRDEFVRREIVGSVGAIREIGPGRFEVEIGLSAATVGDDAGQLLNMLFGNSSLQSDVELADFRLPEEVVARFPGPGLGIAGLRARAGAASRALTCVAIKPQGLSPAGLAVLTEALALGGVDFIKDDHGLADQGYAPFAERVAANAAACRRAAERTGRLACYVPVLNGHYGRMRDEIAIARDNGLDAVMIAPMIAGLSTAQALAAENRDLIVFAHPTMGGAARIAPPALMRLFRLVGGDVGVFPNYGGRFGYSKPTCLALAQGLRAPWGPLKDTIPTPAGGMTTARVDEMLDVYGADTMLLIGGALLCAPPERLVAETAAFVEAVGQFRGMR
jgi:ribulose-bisphosphate carboxylase large chain